MKRCASCKEFKPTLDFGKDKKRSDSLNIYCKECSRVKSKESNRRRRQNPEIKAKILANDRARRKSPEYRAYARALKQKPEYKMKAKALKQTEKHKQQSQKYAERYRQSPERKERIRNYAKNPEVKQRIKLSRQRNKDHVNARTTVYRAIKRGNLPHPTILKCEWENCPEQARHYHHYLGYERENWLKVQALCHTHHGYVSRK